MTRRAADRFARIRKLPLAQPTVVSFLFLPRTVTVNEKRLRHSSVLWHFSVDRIVRPITVSRPAGPSRRPVDFLPEGALTVTVVAGEVEPEKLASPP